VSWHKKLEKILAASVKEDGILIEQQPPFIDYDEGKIKCFWCKELFCGSAQLKYVNQHVWKPTTHKKKRFLENIAVLIRPSVKMILKVLNHGYMSYTRNIFFWYTCSNN